MSTIQKERLKNGGAGGKRTSAKYDLTEGNTFKILLVYAVPILISSIIQYTYNTFDTIMVGQVLGGVPMAAVNSAGTASGLMYSLAGGFAVGISVIVGINHGAKDKEKTLRAIIAAEKLSLGAAVVLTAAGAAAIEPLIKITNVQPEYVEYYRAYITVIMLSAVVPVFNNANTNLLRTLGDSRSPVIMLVVSAVVNVLLNLLFMVGFGWGVFGVALATVASQLTSAVLALIFLFKNYPEYNFFKEKIPKVKDGTLLSEIKMGIPMAFQQSMITIGSVIVYSKVNEMAAEVYGTPQAYTIGNSLNNIASIVINAFGTVASGFVAQNYGAKDLGRMKKGIIYCHLISLALSALIAGAFALFMRPLVGLFMNESDWSEEVYAMSARFVYINMCFYLIWIPVPILRCSIQSMKNSVLPFISCLVELPMRCTAAWVLGEYFGFTGLSFATPCALVAALAFLTVAFFVEWKRKKRAIQKEKEDELNKLKSAENADYNKDNYQE